MFHKNLFIFLFATFSTLSLSFEEEILKCASHDFSLVDGQGKRLALKSSDIYFKYNRSNLAVYTYPETDSVNLFIDHSETSFKVFTKDGELLNLNDEESFEIIGIANFVNSKNYKEGLKDCVFFGAHTKTGRIVFDHFYQVLSKCFASQLCKNLGPIEDEDLSRAKAMPRNFGPISVSSPNIKTLSPKITPSNPTEIEKQDKYEDEVDLMIKKTARKLRTDSNGTIAIDDVKYTVVHAFEGKFSGLDTIHRSGHVRINESLVEHISKFAFKIGIPKGHLEFKHLRTWGVLPFIGVLCADVNALTFRANVTIKFTDKSCQTHLDGVQLADAGFQKTYFCQPKNFLTKWWVKWYIKGNAFLPIIHEDIALRIKQDLNRQIIDHFYCEGLRPSKYFID